jgi:hypothetical protein
MDVLCLMLAQLLVPLLSNVHALAARAAYNQPASFG